MSKLLNECDVDVVIGRDRVTPPFGNQVTREPFDVPAWRYRLWYFFFFAAYLPFFRTFDRDWLKAPHLYKGVPPTTRRLLKVLWRLKVLGVVGEACRKVLDLFPTPPKGLRDDYDLVIAFTGIKDPRYDEVARWARRKNIPVLVVPLNWDNLSSKPFAEEPDFVAVWGEQSQYFARLFHHIPYSRMFLLGAARFEPHYPFVKPKSPEEIASLRRDLGLPDQGKLFLFAGSGENFDELAPLGDIDDAIADGLVDTPVHIVFKPHPLRHRGPVLDDPSYKPYRHVTIWNGLPSDVDVPENTALLAAVDGIISPYSTMVLEGAYFGLPAVGIFYNSAGHAQSDWEVLGRHPNLTPLFTAPWVVECQSREEIVSCFKRLISLANSADTAEHAKRTFSHCVYTDGFEYGERLCTVVGHILGREFFAHGKGPARLNIPGGV